MFIHQLASIHVSPSEQIQFQNGYYATNAKVGQAWNVGAELMKK